MFARTERLMLRPAWPEDAAALATAIGHAAVLRMLSRVPFPYDIKDAADWIAGPCDLHAPRFVIETLEQATPRLIGGIGLSDPDAGTANLGYWLTPEAWGRGYATEAARAVVEIARHALPLTRLTARHFADNPASGRVLRKLGFRLTGTVGDLHSAARDEAAPSVEYALDLADDGRGLMPMAA
ncbi:N-acetyltransferase [Sphingomonas metalli]|uniref:N-acetyltransferase n=1 Tax=Sphingomonas metalli TaxID=1779358 RepID=A0A916SUS0_9SPHN|nr:GNAT family N-acetyltransferase [Sphingomonas metalli]GGB17522.1 N-acetyltransferase [Sphingomonas metalli]